MGFVNVSQILVTPLKRVPVTGGDVLHAIKSTDPGYVGFGETYFSIIELDATKGWKRHLSMTLNLVVPVGAVRFVFIDNHGQILQKIVGENSYYRLTVPPGIWFAFKGLASPYSVIANIADITHDPSEVQRVDLTDMKFNWDSDL